MNSKKHKLPRRLLAMLLAICMFVTMFPSGMLAMDSGSVGGTEQSGTKYDDATEALSDTGVKATKTLSGPDEDGNYTITLDVQGTSDTSSEMQNVPADIVLVVDTSTSMEDEVDGTKICGGAIERNLLRQYVCTECGHNYGRNNPGTTCTEIVSLTRLDVAKSAAANFVNNLMRQDSDVQIGLYDFSGSNRTDVALTGVSGKQTLLDEIDDLQCPRRGDGTDYGLGLSGAQDILQYSEEGRQKFVIFISDGEPNNDDYGTAEANALKQAGVTIFTVGVDVEDNAAQALRNISSSYTAENGQTVYRYYSASTDGSSYALAAILEEIRKEIESTIHAGSDAVMTDIINTDFFEYVANPASEGLSVDEDGKTLTWNIGDITKDEKTVSFKIKLKDSNTADGVLHTNSDVSLTFESNKLGEKVTFNKGAIGDPVVTLENPTAPSNTIDIDLYVDGEQITDKTKYGQYLSVTPVVTDYDSTSGYDEESWNEGSYENGVVSYSRWHYDCKDIDFTANSGYVIEGIEADVVNGQSGWKDFANKDGTITVDNVNGGSTVTVHLRSTYTVNYYEPDGTTIYKNQTGLVADKTNLTANSESVPTPVAGDKYNDQEYIEMGEDQDPVTAAGKQQPYKRVYVAAGLSNTTTVVDLPDAAEGTTVNGWWIEDSDQSGDPTHKEGETYTVNPSDDTDGNKIIAFYSKSTRIPADWDNLKIAKTVDTTTAEPGDTITYTITVTNNTGKDLTDVKVADTLNSHLTLVSATATGDGTYANGVWSIGSLTNGSSVTLTIKATINEDVSDGEVIKNVATVTDAKDGDDNLPDKDKPSDDADVTVDIPADWGKLTIDKEVDKETAKPGETVTYTITVTNNTGKDLTDVKVADTLDSRLAFVKADPEGSYTDGVWTIGNLKDGAKVELEITATINDNVAAGTEIENVATITDAKDGDDKLPDGTKPSDSVDVKVEPKDPTSEDITKLINEAQVTVNCTNEDAEHDPMTVKFGEVNNTKFDTNRDGDTITVTVDTTAFIANYVAERNNIPHSYVENGSDLTLTLKYVEGAWTLDNNDNTVTINTICNLPQPPADDDLIKLLNEATADVECITPGSNHNKETFNFGETDYKFTTEQSDPYTINVEVDPAAFIADYDGIYESEVHTFVQPEDVAQDLQLVIEFVDGAWTLTDNSIDIKVSCGFDLTGIDKTLVTSGELEDAAKDAGVEVTNYFLPASMEDTVIVPYNGSVTLLYAITVEGKGGADFAVQDPTADLVNTPINTTAQISKDDTTGMFIGTIPEGEKSVTFYVSRTFTADDIEDGVLSNMVELSGSNGSTVDPDNKDEETIPAEEGTTENVVQVTPADITVYEGGNGGYAGVVGDGDVTDADSNMPHPMFYISVPDGSDPTNLTFTNDGKVWTVVADGTDANGKPLYHFEQGEGQDPVRVTYTYEKDGRVITVNDLSQLGDIGEVFTYLRIDLYAGENNLADVRASFGGKSYAITASSGTLTVRAVEADDPDTVTSDIRDTAPTADEGTAVAVEPENTTYTLNDTNVALPEDSKPSLLFDNIINDDGVDRTAALEAKAAEKLNADSGDYNYEIMYLDLVDANNGNAWITSSEGTDIYWDYPEGTDKNTDFQVLHFTGLHREGDQSGFDIEDLNNIDMSEIENVKITKTDNYIVFHVKEANFSPYALAWDADNGSGDNPGSGGNPGWTPGGGDGPDGLNTEDHFSYIVGYAEDYRTGEATDDESLWPVKPQNNITRAEVATIFYRLLEDEVRDEYDTTVNDFSDVSADAWYNQTVSTLSSMGIVKGYEDGTFRPNAPITRAEFAAIATRFFAQTGATYEPGTFSDVVGDEWFAGAIQDAVNLGLIGGYEDGTVRPNNNITRAEACAIVNRTLGRVPDVDHLLPEDVMKTWPDNPESAWFYADMQEATNGHEYEWITEDGNKVENWTEIMLDNDWTER